MSSSEKEGGFNVQLRLLRSIDVLISSGDVSKAQTVVIDLLRDLSTKKEAKSVSFENGLPFLKSVGNESETYSRLVLASYLRLTSIGISLKLDLISVYFDILRKYARSWAARLESLRYSKTKQYYHSLYSSFLRLGIAASSMRPESGTIRMCLECYLEGFQCFVLANGGTRIGQIWADALQAGEYTLSHLTASENSRRMVLSFYDRVFETALMYEVKPEEFHSYLLVVAHRIQLEISSGFFDGSVSVQALEVCDASLVEEKDKTTFDCARVCVLSQLLIGFENLEIGYLEECVELLGDPNRFNSRIDLGHLLCFSHRFLVSCIASLPPYTERMDREARLRALYVLSMAELYERGRAKNLPSFARAAKVLIEARACAFCCFQDDDDLGPTVLRLLCDVGWLGSLDASTSFSRILKHLHALSLQCGPDLGVFFAELAAEAGSLADKNPSFAHFRLGNSFQLWLHVARLRGCSAGAWKALDRAAAACSASREFSNIASYCDAVAGLLKRGCIPDRVCSVGECISTDENVRSELLLKELHAVEPFCISPECESYVRHLLQLSSSLTVLRGQTTVQCANLLRLMDGTGAELLTEGLSILKSDRFSLADDVAAGYLVFALFCLGGGRNRIADRSLRVAARLWAQATECRNYAVALARLSMGVDVCEMRGLLIESIAICKVLVTAARRDGNDAVVVSALARIGRLYGRLGRPDVSPKFFDAADSFITENDYGSVYTDEVSCARAEVCCLIGELEPALENLNKLEKSGSAVVGHLDIRARCLYLQGLLDDSQRVGLRALARRLHRFAGGDTGRFLEIADDDGKTAPREMVELSSLLLLLGMTSVARGIPREGRYYFARGIDASRKAPLLYFACLTESAALSARSHRWDDAESGFAEAQSFLQEQSAEWSPLSRSNALTLLLVKRGDMQLARRCPGRASELYDEALSSLTSSSLLGADSDEKEGSPRLRRFMAAGKRSSMMMLSDPNVVLDNSRIPVPFVHAHILVHRGFSRYLDRKPSVQEDFEAACELEKGMSPIFAAGSAARRLYLESMVSGACSSFDSLRKAWELSRSSPLPPPLLHRVLQSLAAIPSSLTSFERCALLHHSLGFAIRSQMGVLLRKRATKSKTTSPSLEPFSRTWVSGEELMKEVRSVPEEWTIVSLSWAETRCVAENSLSEDGGSESVLIVSRLSSRGRPLIRTVPLPQGEPNRLLGSLAAVVEETRFFDERSSLDSSKMTDKDKRTYHRTKEILSRRLEDVVNEMESVWLGHWKILLAGSMPVDERSVSFLTRHSRLSKDEMLEFARVLPSGWHSLTDSERLSLISELCEEGVGERAIGAYADHLASCGLSVDDSRQSVRRTSGRRRPVVASRKALRDPVVLITDGLLHGVPFEAFLPMRRTPVTRLPSLAFVLSGSLRSLNRDGRFVLNPTGEFSHTERTCGELFKRLGFHGITGREPSSEEYAKLLVESDLFVFCGHNAGEKYLPRDRVLELSHLGVVLLMGCSSGRLEDEGEFEPGGLALSYLLGGAHSVVANLWEVTEMDCDRFLQVLLECWRGEPSFASLRAEFKHSTPPYFVSEIVPYSTNSLAESIVLARQAPRLSTTRFAPVCYGIPAFVK